MKKLLRFAVVLFIICLVSGSLLTGTYIITAPRIEQIKKAAEEAALLEVFPQARGGRIEPVKKEEKVLYFKAYAPDAERPTGYIFKTEARGYSSIIEIMVGIDLTGKILGMKILDQKETPGLGARIVEPWFQEQFKGKRPEALRVVKRETRENIQAITGATISSEAVAEAVKAGIERILERTKH